MLYIQAAKMSFMSVFACSTDPGFEKSELSINHNELWPQLFPLCDDVGSEFRTVVTLEDGWCLKEKEAV